MKKPFLKCKSCFRPIKNVDGTLRFPTNEEIELLKDGINPKQICNECCNLFKGTSLLQVAKELEGFTTFIQNLDEVEKQLDEKGYISDIVLKLPKDLE